MIPRTAADTLQRLSRGFPVIALTGPRQSEKTTLAKAVFAGKPYVSLENPDEREFADLDPKRFLQRFDEGAILDEVQRCPALLSWLQGLVDERGRMGFRLLKSSQAALLHPIGLPQRASGKSFPGKTPLHQSSYMAGKGFMTGKPAGSWGGVRLVRIEPNHSSPAFTAQSRARVGTSCWRHRVFW